MRLLHTSDWHLGRQLHRADLSAGHEAFVDHLVATVGAESVDLVVVAGDVFDRAIPPVAAVALYEDALARLRSAGARVVVTSGNHDSAPRLGVNSRLIDASGVHVRTRAAHVAEPVLLSDEHGDVAVYAVPYLEPDTVRDQLPGDPLLGVGHAAVLGQATAAARADLAGRRRTRGIAVAHGWVSGGAASDSERDISVGGVGDVPVSLFDGFAYTALGHLHRPQAVRDTVRYSGSPLPFSFSEIGYAKSSWLVELGARSVAVEAVPAPVLRPLSVVRGPIADLLTSREHDAVEDHFLSATITDRVLPVDALGQLRRRFPHVLQLRHEPLAGERSTESYSARVAGRSDLDVATGFVDHVRGAAASEEETALLASALDAARVAEDAEAGAA